MINTINSYLLIASLLLVLGLTLSLPSNQSNPSVEPFSDDMTRCKNYSSKPEPSPENRLANECKPWSGLSCCDESTAKAIQSIEDPLGLSFVCRTNESAKDGGSVLSPNCHRYFARDACFHACEPHTAQWTVPTDFKGSQEKLEGVPICADLCDKWYEACLDDLFCDLRKAKHELMGKVCDASETECTKIGDMFANSSDFCNNIFDHAYRYTSKNDGPCMVLWFNGTKDNPNRLTAKHYLKLGSSNVGNGLVPSILGLIVSLILIVL